MTCSRLASVACGAMLGVGFLGCQPASDSEPPPPDSYPVIEALSTTEAAVGDRIELSGHGFPSREVGWVDVRFVGDFMAEGADAPEPVDFVTPLQADASGKLVWERFGAYRVPFAAAGERIGTFEGEVRAVNRYFDGTVEEAPDSVAMPLTFRVLPSLVVLDFRAVGNSWIADCRYPTPVALNLVPYAMRVRAVGFEPSEFEYVVSEGLWLDGESTADATRVVYPTLENEHTILAQFAPVPEYTDGYAMSIVVKARDGSGALHELPYHFTVRRPLQAYFTAPMQIAQIHEPDIVSGCIPGGVSGIDTSYSETRTETRTRSLQRAVERSWETSYGTQHGQTWGMSDTTGGSTTMSTAVTVTDTRSSDYTSTTTDMFSMSSGRTRANRVDFSQSGSEEYNWSVQDEDVHDFSKEGGGSAGGSLFGIVEVGAQGKVGWVDGTRHREGMGGSVESTVTGSRGATATSSYEESRARSQAESIHWGLSQSYSEANSFSQSRTWQNTRSYDQSVVESMTRSMRIGETETEIYTVSTSESESLMTSGRIFPEHFGVWYRQTTRLVRASIVVAYDLCGNGSEVGDLYIDDWVWAPNLAIGTECPPETNLPPAQCQIEQFCGP